MPRDFLVRREANSYSDGERSDLSSEPEPWSESCAPVQQLDLSSRPPASWPLLHYQRYLAAASAGYIHPATTEEQQEPLNLTLPRREPPAGTPPPPLPQPMQYSYIVRRRDEDGAEHVTYLSPHRTQLPQQMGYGPPPALHLKPQMAMSPSCYTSPQKSAASLTPRSYSRVELTHSLSKSCPPPLVGTPTKSPASPPGSASKAGPNTARRKRVQRATRRLTFDEEKSSPISGTLIRDLPDGQTVSGDIDPALNMVEVSDEARSELAKIQNKLGEYVCTLCRTVYENAFTLAQHRCPRIVHVEYRCPECDKVFNCPANLASHRRWHRPRGERTAAERDAAKDSEPQRSCYVCGRKFKRMTLLKKHMESHLVDSIPSRGPAPGGIGDYLSLYADRGMSLAAFPASAPAGLPPALVAGAGSSRDRSPVR